MRKLEIEEADMKTWVSFIPMSSSVIIKSIAGVEGQLGRLRSSCETEEIFENALSIARETHYSLEDIRQHIICYGSDNIDRLSNARIKS
jgi:hypothetical protein